MNLVVNILLVLLLILLLLLLVPLGGKLEFSDEGLSFCVRLGPVYYRLYPPREEKASEPEEFGPPPDKPSREQQKPPPAPEPKERPEAAPPEVQPQEPPDESEPEDSAPGQTGEPPEQSEAVPSQPEQSGGQKKRKRPKEKKPPLRKRLVRRFRKRSGSHSRGHRPGERTGTVRETIGGKLELAMKLVPDLMDLLGLAARWMRVDELTLNYTIPGRWDAAGAAIQYGTVYSTGGVLYPLLSERLHVKRWRVDAEIDFQEEVARVYVCLNLCWRVWAVLVLAVKLLRFYQRYQKLTTEQEQK